MMATCWMCADPRFRSECQHDHAARRGPADRGVPLVDPRPAELPPRREGF